MAEAAAPPAAAELRYAAARLAAEFERSGFHEAAAYAEMAAEAVGRATFPPEDRRTDIESEFCLDEHGRVWIILEGDCHVIGRRGAVCAEMRRFLVSALPAKGAP
jgi:hypothetical protein